MCRIVVPLTVAALFFAFNPHLVFGQAGPPCSLFAEPETLELPFESPRYLAIGDFDGDQDSDLALTYQGGSVVSVFLNNGDGVFAEDETYTMVGAAPRSICAGDLDGDSDIDLAVSDTTSDRGLVFLNDGKGAFETADEIIMPGGLSEVFELTDLDGDNDLDLIGRSGSNKLVTYLNNGDGSFAEKPGCYEYEQVRTVATGDLDGDGDEDLVLRSQLGGAIDNVHVLLNDGAANFNSETTLVVRDVIYICASDLNDDNHKDVILVHNSDGDVSIYLNDGAGNLGAPSVYDAGYEPSQAVVGDFDGDSDQDVIVQNTSNGHVLVLLNDGEGNFLDGGDYPTGANPSDVHSTDVDGDNDPDLVYANRSIDVLSVMRNTCITLGDVNEDGVVDLLDVQPFVGILIIGDYLAAADINGDGVVNLLDLEPFVAILTGP